MLHEMEKAESYIILQTYIFRDDEIGNKFADLLMKKASEGLRVTFIHDDIGNDMPVKLIKKLSEAGVKVSPFNDRLLKHKVQINFRNHRKILIIDGKVGFVGGHNIGDDYLGKWKKWGPWRDTHVKISGPSVIAAQVACAKDWYFSLEESLEADWEITESSKDAQVMILHTGPADERHTCLLAHIALINSAQKRLWIASPYMVPPESLVDALLMASLRGVDVCLILPSYSDSFLILHASKVYQERLLDHGIKLFSYTEGFLHQKVMLIDSKIATVGSANFDCRSMFINFEVTAITTDGKFIKDMEEMLTRDFAKSKKINKETFKKEPIVKKISARSANLLAPML
jgi:cardiolipin synthase